MGDDGLADQLQQASVLMMTKILEGLGSDSDAALIQRLDAAHRSAAEVQRLLRAARDQACITNTEFAASYEHAKRVSQMVASFTAYLNTEQGQTPQGRQFSERGQTLDGQTPRKSLGRRQVVGELARGAIFDV